MKQNFTLKIYWKKIIVYLLLFCSTENINAQLLQWNTFGNAGTEPTETSVFNNGNITTADLTQGAIIAENNANRFGGRAWFNTGNTATGNTLAEAIAGNDYIQFIVTPNANTSFTPTSFVFSWERSTFGPQNVTLRSSVDAFSSDLGTLSGLAASITTGNTITISGISNLTSATTFRLYGYGATATTGTGGFDVNSNVVNVQLNGTAASVITSSGNGAWNSTTPNAPWPSGIVPTNAQNVIIAHNVSIPTGTPITRNSGTSTTINTGASLATSSTYANNGMTTVNGTFQLNGGGFANGNAFTYGASGTLNFNDAGNYGVDNNHVYWPTTNGPFNVNVLQNGMTLNAGANRSVAGTFSVSNSGSFGVYFPSATLTINGICRLDAGGVFRNTPTYGNTSTLVYNVNYGVFNEWTGNSTTAGVGVPQNVTIQNNATVTLPSAVGPDRGIAGNLNINSGTLSLGTGDFFIAGNWNRASTGTAFNPNGKAVFFNGNNTQTITSLATGGETFNYLVLNNSNAAGVRLLSNVTVNATIGSVLQLINTGPFDLNGQTLNLTNNGGSIFVNGIGRRITSLTAASINIIGSKNVSNNSGFGTLSFESNITIALTNNFDFGNSSGAISTLAGTLRLDLLGAVNTNPPIYTSTSTLIYNSGTNYSNVAEWTSGAINTVTAGLGVPANVIIQNAGTNVGLAGGRGLPGNLIVENGATLTLNGGPNQDLYTKGNLLFNGSGAFVGNNKAIFFVGENITQTINSAASLTIPYIVIAPFSGSTIVQLLSNLSVTAPLGFNAISFNSASDQIDLNGRTLIIGTINVSSVITGAGAFKGSTTSNLTLVGNGSIGTLNFIPLFQDLGTLTIQRQNATLAATLGTPLTVNSSLLLTSGLLALGNNNLTLTSAVASSGSDNAFIVTNGTGSLRKNWSGPGSFTFHVGESTGTTEYSPATLQFTGGVFGANNYTGVRVIDAAQPNIPVSADNYITRYWPVSSNNITGATIAYNFTGTYLPADEVLPITADALSGRWDGTNWIDGDALSANTISVTGLTTLPAINDFTGAKITGKNHFFRSSITGNWNDKSSWESSKDGLVNWVNATNYPGNSAGAISIRNTHTITLTAEEKARLLTVETGGTLTNTNLAGGYLLDIAEDGTATNDFVINGTYELFGNGPAFGTGATAIVNTGAIVRANANTNNQSDLFALLNNVSFQNASIFEWNTTDAFAFNGDTYFPTATSTIPIFRLRQTPSANIGSGTDATINGIFQVNSNITLFGGSEKTFRNGIAGNAILTQNSGSFRITSPNSVLGGANLRIVLSSPLNLLNTVFVPVDSMVTISGGNISNNTIGNVLTINGTLDLTDRSITNNAGTVIINGTFRTTNTGGFTGSGAIPSGTVNLNNSSSTVEYYASANQIVTNRADYFNVILSGSNTKTPTSGFDPDGTITINGTAIFDCTGLNMGDAGTSLTMTGGKLIVSTGGTQPAMGGTYNLTGGTIEFAGASAKSIRNQTYQNIEVTGSNVGNSSGNIFLRTNGNFIIRENGVFEINANAIVGLGTNERVTVDFGGTFRTGDIDGFSGSAGTSVSTTIDHITLNPGSTVVYSRSDPPLTGANQVITNTHTYQNLEISGNGIKTPPLGATLTIQGNLIKSGSSTFQPNNGLVLLNGSGSQTFAGLPYSRLQLTNGSKTTSGSASIDSLLKIDASTTLNVSSGDSIVILSTANRTASVGRMQGAINYLGTGLTAGKFVVQRYLLSGRKWRLLSVPTNNINQTVRNSWQENGVDNAGFGFRAVDTRSNWASLGYDGLGNNSSIKKFNPITESWDAIDNTNIMPLQTDSAYFVFVPGDRSITFPGAGSTTLRTRGQLITGNVGPIDVPDGQFAVIGNPYASRIDIRSINFSGLGIDQSITVWDPSITTGYGLGAYNQLLFDGTSYKNQLSSAVYGPFNTDNNFIESGQAFVVRATGPSSLTFNEDDKELGSNLASFVSGDPQQLRVHLNVVPNGGSPVLLDGVMTQFDTSYSNSIDYLDIKKINPFGESVSWDVADALIVVERRAPVLATDTLQLSMGNLRVQNYQWELIAENLDFPGREGFLIDRFINSSTPLNMAGTTTFNFDVNNAAGSFAANRFYIVFNQQAGGPLPVTFTTVTATRNADRTVAVQWKVEQEINIVSYEMERSNNGSNFTTAHSRTASGNNSSSVTYDHIDLTPYSGDNFYRIKASSVGGQVQYSNIVKLSGSKATPLFSVYPNPVVDGKMQLNFTSQPVGRYGIQLLNTAGQVVYKSAIPVGAANQTTLVSLGVAKGSYRLLITNPGGVTTNLPVLLQ